MLQTAKENKKEPCARELAYTATKIKNHGLGSVVREQRRREKRVGKKERTEECGTPQNKAIKRHPTAIARLVNAQKRNNMYANRFIAKEIEEFPVGGMQNLYAA